MNCFSQHPIVVRNNLWDWQSLDADSGGGEFFNFCDALEVKQGKIAPATGFGLNNALAAWGNFWKTSYLDGRMCLTRRLEMGH